MLKEDGIFRADVLGICRYSSCCHRVACTPGQSYLKVLLFEKITQLIMQNKHYEIQKDVTVSLHLHAIIHTFVLIPHLVNHPIY